jgi:Adipocyte plasma membrane-associated protein-like, N-terminal
MREILISVVALALALAAYLLFWPVPIQPVAWEVSKAPGYSGAHAVNTHLANLQKIEIGKEVGPEHLAIGPDGKLYAAMASGNMLRMQPDGSAQEVFVNTQGRVLGFDFDAAGKLLTSQKFKRQT